MLLLPDLRDWVPANHIVHFILDEGEGEGGDGVVSGLPGLQRKTDVQHGAGVYPGNAWGNGNGLKTAHGRVLPVFDRGESETQPVGKPVGKIANNKELFREAEF